MAVPGLTKLLNYLTKGQPLANGIYLPLGRQTTVTLESTGRKIMQSVERIKEGGLQTEQGRS